VRALYDDRNVRRVVALGVLHGAGLAPYRTALDPAAARGAREEAFALVSGAFLVSGEAIATAFGALPLLAGDEADGVRVDRTGLLKAEFSLDTFASILRAAADALGRPPLPILPLYVGMTRNPTTGSFGVAERVADWVRRHADAATAVVATGDLVHYGSAYGGAWASDDARSAAALERLLRSEVERALGLAFAERDWEQAYRLSNERIRNDQREMLAVLSAYLGEGASASVLAFELSDYSKILAAASPCVVASALVDYRRK